MTPNLTPDWEIRIWTPLWRIPAWTGNRWELAAHWFLITFSFHIYHSTPGDAKFLQHFLSQSFRSGRSFWKVKFFMSSFPQLPLNIQKVLFTKTAAISDPFQPSNTKAALSKDHHSSWMSSAGWPVGLSPKQQFKSGQISKWITQPKSTSLEGSFGFLKDALMLAITCFILIISQWLFPHGLFPVSGMTLLQTSNSRFLSAFSAAGEDCAHL